MGRLIVDTPLWSILVGRSGHPNAAPLRREMRDTIAQGEALLIGPVRQEVLTGIRSLEQFVSLRTALSGIPDEPLEPADFERAAQFANQCRAAGVQSSPVDVLLCAVAERLDAPIFTLDRDFEQYAGVIPIQLHPLPGTA